MSFAKTTRCGCVRLNHEIGVVTLVDQEREHRRPLEQQSALGEILVAATLTAHADCPECGGTGEVRAR